MLSQTKQNTSLSHGSWPNQSDSSASPVENEEMQLDTF